jgi:hypothetical protein
MDSLALTLTIINAGQAVLDEAQAQIDALPTEKVVNITVTTNAPAVAAETAEATTAESADIDATIAQLLAGNEEFETQFLLAQSAAQLAIGKTDLALAGLAGAEAKSGSALVAVGGGEDAVAAGGDAIMGSMGAMLTTLAPIAALFGVGLGFSATLDIMKQQTLATAALNNALKDTKTSIPSSELDSLSNKMSNMGFDNVDVTNSLTNFTLATKSGSKAVTDEAAAADLARYSHISLGAATTQLIKGSQGQSRQLKQLALEGLIPVINNQKAMAAAHTAVATAQTSLNANTNSLTNTQIAYNDAVQKYGPNSAQAEKASRSLANATASHQGAVDKLATANTNLKNKQKDLADPTWQMSQLVGEIHTKIGGLAQAQSHTLGGAFDIVKAKVENFVGGVGQGLENWFIKNQGTIMDVAGVILGPLSSAFGAIGDAISNVVGTLTKFYDKNKTIIDDILNVLVKIVGTVLVVAFKLLSTEVQIFVQAFVIAFDIAMFAVQLLINVIEAIVGVVAKAIPTVIKIFGGIVNFFKDLPGNIWNAILSIGGFFTTLSVEMINAITSFIGSVLTWFQQLPGNIWNAILSIGGFFLKLGLQMDTDVVNFLATVLGFFTGLPGNIWNAITTGVGDIAGFFEKIGVTAISNVSTFISSILDFFKKLPGEIWDFIKSVPGLIAKMVSNIPVLGGVISGASSLIGDLGKIIPHAQGGIINEPIIGYGLNTGQGYSFGENGSEAIVPLTGAANGLGAGGAGGGNVQLIFSGNYLLSNNALTQFAQQVEKIVVTKLLPAGGRMVTLG